MKDSAADVHFRRIGWKDTLDVVALSHSLLPRELCRATHSLLALFVNFERQNTNLSFGLYSGNKLVGYMLVYFLNRSLYHDREERIVHIDEYCVMPGFRGRAREVITRLVLEFGLFQKRSGIEAIATGDALEHWMGIGRVVAGFGYETNLRENDCERAGHAMGRIRWEFKADESWKPDTALKLPKPLLSHAINGSDYELLLVRNPRQWLSLQSAYNELAGKDGSCWFNYGWQWWRHFGISEELNVLALRAEGKVLCIVPLSVKPPVDEGESSSLSPMAINSAFPTCPVLCAPDLREQLQATMQQLISCNTAELSETTSEAVEAAFDIPRERPNEFAVAKPNGWFGLNRRECELHRSFIDNAANDR